MCWKILREESLTSSPYEKNIYRNIPFSAPSILNVFQIEFKFLNKKVLIEPNADIIVTNGTTNRINLIVILLVSDLYLRQRNENKYGSRY